MTLLAEYNCAIQIYRLHIEGPLRVKKIIFVVEIERILD